MAFFLLRDCVYSDENLCRTCPQIDEQPAIPPVVITSPNVGWNAGANSVAALDGNLHVAFNVSGSENGVILGFRDARDGRPPTTPTFVTHGWYFFSLHGAWALPFERGAQIGSPIAYNATDLFEIRRVNSVVTYARNDVIAYTSTQPSSGLLRVMTCLYAAGDSVQ